MTYDLRRLRLTGLIHRIEHTSRYVLIPDGVKMAVFYSKLHDRLLRPPTSPKPTARTARYRPACRRLHHPRPPRHSRVKT
jgi:hypothetical protein